MLAQILEDITRKTKVFCLCMVRKLNETFEMSYDP